MNENPIISAHQIGKCYLIYQQPQDRLKQSLLGRFGRNYAREFWALGDISFELKRGETLGVIGRNGSGKSTLLQIVAGTLAPTTGEIQISGRVAALLELGSGFNPEYSGRENVFINGAILGIPRAEMESRVGEIIAFADIGEFIDQPVKVYSSGMYVRLAFAVATSVDADILVIDEALAVGDVFFRQKCYKRLESMRKNGVAIILVSHAMMEVEQFCQRCLLLEKGHIVFQGSASKAVNHYYLIEQKERRVETVAQFSPKEQKAGSDFIKSIRNSFWPEPEAFFDISGVSQVSNGWARCTGVALCNSKGEASRTFRQGEAASFFYEFKALSDFEVPIAGLIIQDEKGIIVHGKNTLQYNCEVPISVSRGTRLRIRQDIDLQIANGEYTFGVGLATLARRDYDRHVRFSHVELNSKQLRLCQVPTTGKFAVTFEHLKKGAKLLHHGLANLPGKCQVMLDV